MSSSAPRHVLVVAYYFPPMGLSGVQRIARFVKYLPEFGWIPTVVTVEPGGYFAFDPSFDDEIRQAGVNVVRTRSLDVTRLFGSRKAVRLPSDPARNFLSVLSQAVFIPDNKIGWYWPAYAAIRRLSGRSRFSAVFSSAPPYTAHLIGRAVSRLLRIPLVCDFRDDWVGNPRHFYPTSLHRRVHIALERRVLSQSDAVVTINGTIGRSLMSRHPDALKPERVHVIPQGYDPADFQQNAHEPKDERSFTLLYTGIFYDAQRPDTMLEAVAQLRERRPDLFAKLRLEFAGLLPESAWKRVRELGLEDIVDFRGYLAHRAVVKRMLSADVLWMTVGRRPGAEGISTGKLFEYFGAGKPILALVPSGEARDALRDHGAAYTVDPDDVSGTSHEIERMMDDWERGQLPVPDEDFIHRFDRRALTAELAQLFDEVIEHNAIRGTR